MFLKKTKVVATIGPASAEKKILTDMIVSGLNVARLNFSHGDHQTHKKSLDLVRSVSSKTKIPVAVLQDLSGPKIRTGEMTSNLVELKNGSQLILTPKKFVGDEKKLSITYKNLHKEVKVGERILLDDGRKELKVTKIKGEEIYTKIIVGGHIKPRRGVNLPDTSLKVSSLTAKDKKDVLFGIESQVDFIALSFVRSAKDVLDLRKILNSHKSDIAIIAKIETPDAIKNIDKIIEVSDGIMVARGDLAVEVCAENVPIYQKMIVDKCNKAGKSVIVATQMLESMINMSVPTRAEVSDVANSILDGADAIMLSEETAMGKHPALAIKIMTKVARKVEDNYPYTDFISGKFFRVDDKKVFDTVDAITHYAFNTARDVGAKLIVALTESSLTSRMVSRYKPRQPIMVMSPNDRALKRSLLSFGCYPYKIRQFREVREAREAITSELLKNKFIKKGEKYVLSAGVPFGKSGGTNMLMVWEV